MDAGFRWPKPGLKNISLACLAAFFVFESEMALDLTTEAVMMAVEALEQGADNLLEKTFGFDRRSAQCISAWTGLGLLLTAGYFLLKRLGVWFSRQWMMIRYRYAMALDMAIAMIRERQIIERIRLYALVMIVAYFLIFF
jgi:hypothetical protein